MQPLARDSQQHHVLQKNSSGFFNFFKKSIHHILPHLNHVFRGGEGLVLHVGDVFAKCRHALLLHMLAHGVEIAVLFGVAGERPGTVAQNIFGKQKLYVAAAARAYGRGDQRGALGHLAQYLLGDDFDLHRPSPGIFQCFDLPVQIHGLVSGFADCAQAAGPGAFARHQADMACPIGPHTWDAALAATEVATTAADLVLTGTREAYALCRPPGHHAFADMAGGFCFLNNSAVAAQHLRSRHARVAVLDVDVHHGNGTQGIFYERADVLTVSIHADPANYYPYFWGHAHEAGTGEGDGFNLNLPLPLGSADAPWLAAGDTALTRIAAFAPTALVVALGLDASESDPLQGLKVTGAGFHAMAARIARLGLPTVLVQEGGYLGDDLGRNLVQFLAGFEKGRG